MSTEDMNESKDMRRRDDRILKQLYSSIALLFLGQLGTIVYVAYEIGRFTGSIGVRINHIEQQQIISRELSKNVTALNATMSHLNDSLSRLRSRLDKIDDRHHNHGGPKNGR